MTQIADGFNVTGPGPDADGDYEFEMTRSDGASMSRYLTRAQADRLIALLTPEPPVAPREPSDDQIANGPNREGGIGFRTEDTLSYRDGLKDAGRRG